jgi:hypothetical protein
MAFVNMKHPICNIWNITKQHMKHTMQPRPGIWNIAYATYETLPMPLIYEAWNILKQYLKHMQYG